MVYQCHGFLVTQACQRTQSRDSAPAAEADQNCADKNQNFADKRRKLHPPFAHLFQSRASW